MPEVLVMLELEPGLWAEQNFASCQLGDQRRTRRAVHYAALVAAKPEGSTPQQVEKWSDLKAIYGMLANEDVTFAALTQPHFELTRRQCRQQRHVLLLDDTTEVSFNHRAKIEGLGMLQHEQQQGFLLHSSLALDAATDEVLGLAGQTIRHRRRVKREHANRRLQREDRESRLWGDVIDQVGPPPDGVRYTHVCDRGADNFEVLCHFQQQSCDFVVRAAQLTRTVEVAEAKQSLQEALQAAPLLGAYQLDVPASSKQKGRTALLEVRAVSVTLPPPHNTTAYVRQSGIRSITLTAIEAREAKPRHGWPVKQETLHWVLLTSHVSSSWEQAWEVLGFYERRWTVEEFHKGLKTGCNLEGRQYTTAHSLEAVTAILSVAAVRLLQIKTLAKREPELPATNLIPRSWLSALSHLRNKEIITIHQFLRELAGLGGFLGRKGDGEPGWITLWRGFDKLSLILRGLEIPRRRSG
jgi:hypothetical protein